MKKRLDVLVFEKGYADSRERAKAIIMSGNVFIDGQREDKAGSTFPVSARLEVKGQAMKYVSRGGYKLEKAIEEYGVVATNILHMKICVIVVPRCRNLTYPFNTTVLHRNVLIQPLCHGFRDNRTLICFQRINLGLNIGRKSVDFGTFSVEKGYNTRLFI